MKLTYGPAAYLPRESQLSEYDLEATVKALAQAVGNKLLLTQRIGWTQTQGSSLIVNVDPSLRLQAEAVVYAAIEEGGYEVYSRG